MVGIILNLIHKNVDTNRHSVSEVGLTLCLYGALESKLRTTQNS